MSKEIYEQITNTFLAALEEERIPWRKPWSAGPRNFSTGSEYHGINFWLLSMIAEKNQWPNRWATFNQVKGLDGSIVAGSKGTRIYFWKPLKIKGKGTKTEGGESTQEKYRTIPLLKTFTVFNLAQCSGLPLKVTESTQKVEPSLEADQITTAYCEREGLKVETSHRAAYSPSKDLIYMPDVGAFTERAEYYSTFFHELVHSTGHGARLSREGIVETHYFGDETYSKEELIAEMGASFLCSKAAVSSPQSFANSKAYIQGWISALKNDPKLLMQAASKAQRAADYVLNGKGEVQS